MPPFKLLGQYSSRTSCNWVQEWTQKRSHLKIKFWWNMPPDSPSMCVLKHAPLSVPPPPNFIDKSSTASVIICQFIWTDNYVYYEIPRAYGTVFASICLTMFFHRLTNTLSLRVAHYPSWNSYPLWSASAPGKHCNWWRLEEKVS